MSKRYVDGCGGSTHAMILQRDGFAIISPDASRVEDRLLKLEHVFSNVAKSFFDSRDNDEEFGERVQRLERVLKEARPDFTGRRS